MVIINREHGVYPGLYAFDRLLIGNAANADIDSSIVCPGSFVQQEQADGIDRALTQVSGPGFSSVSRKYQNRSALVLRHP